MMDRRQNPGSSSVLAKRAALVVAFARELLGEAAPIAATHLHLPLTVGQFTSLFRARYATEHPELVFRSESSTERARLERRLLPHLPKVLLKQGAPRREDDAADVSLPAAVAPVMTGRA